MCFILLLVPYNQLTEIVWTSRAAQLSFRNEHRKQDLNEKKLLLAQHEHGLITKDEWRAAMEKIDNAAATVNVVLCQVSSASDTSDLDTDNDDDE